MAIDLRSDFISRPTLQMVEAMVEAARSKCAFGLREDPFQQRLEELAAQILGKEDALFFPTCTMCNQTAIHIFCSPGEKFIAESTSHVLFSEAGAPASLSGVMATPIRGEMGCMNLQEMEEAIHIGDELRSRTALIVLENTHLRSGGTVLSPAKIKEISQISTQHNVPIHLDGARLWNAAVFLRLPVSNLTQYVDSVAASLNKGLAAPMGAVLAGTKPFIREAVRVRQMFGGGWRPTNILAAAGIVALETMIDRLDEDHINTKKLAEALTECEGVSVNLRSVQTNLLVARINHPSLTVEQIIERLREKEIFVIPFGPGSLRMALYWEIGEKEVDLVIKAFQQILTTK